MGYYDEGPSVAGLLQNFLTSYQQAKREKRQEEETATERALRERMAKAEMLQKGFKLGESGNYEMTPEALEDRELDKQFKQSQIAKNLAEAKNGGNPLKQTLDAINLKLKENELDKIDREKTPAGKLEKLGADARAKVGAIATALQSLQDYKSEFNKGTRRSLLTTETPFIGKFVEDNPIDTQTRKLSDDIGRMRSGGVIGVKEDETFKGFLPRSSRLDSDETAKNKLTNFEKELATRLNAYGLSPADLSAAGFQYEPVTFKETTPNKGLLNNQAQASTGASRPKRVRQNGHTFILNEKTGEYEPEN